jgi:hypothetical protein
MILISAFAAALLASTSAFAQVACENPTSGGPYSADPAGVADSTAAIQHAVNAASAGSGMVCIPKGYYKITAPITITSGHLTIAGAGDDSTVFMPTNAGDTFRVALSTPGPYVSGVTLRDFRVYRTDNPSVGVALHYVGVHQSTAQNIRITGTYGGVWCETCITSSFHNVNVIGDNTSAGSFGYMFTRASYTGATNNSEVFVSQTDVRALHAPNLTYPLYVENADGIWFTGGHFGFSSGPALSLIPQDATSQLTGIHCDGCEFDTATDGIYIAQPSGFSSFLGSFQFSGSAAILMSGYGIHIDASATSLKGLTADGFFFNHDVAGSTLLGAGTGVSITNPVVE